MLCLAAIFFNTGSFNTMGSTSLFGYGLSGDPNGAYAETTIPVIDRKTQVYQETKNYFMVPDQWDWSRGQPRSQGLFFRDLKIPRRERLGRLPEVNILYRACAWELSNQLSAVLVSSRTSFRLSCRRIENVSILPCYAWTNVPIDLIFGYLYKFVSKVHIFHDCRV